MPGPELLEIELAGATLRAALHKPDAAPPDAPLPAVLICRGVQLPGEDAHTLLDEITQTLGDAGIAVVHFEHRCADLILADFDAHVAAQDLEDAQAVLDRVMARADINPRRLGVIGFSLGAIAATALAQRNPAIANLCLLAASTAAHIHSVLTHGNGTPPPLNPSHLPASYLASLGDIDSPAEAAAHDRPTLILHGAADRFVPPGVSLEYLEALEQAKRRAEHVLVARANHTFSSPEARVACLDQLRRFFSALANADAAPALVRNRT